MTATTRQDNRMTITTTDDRPAFPTAPSATSVPELDMEDIRRDLYAGLQHIEDLRRTQPYEASGYVGHPVCTEIHQAQKVTIPGRELPVTGPADHTPQIVSQAPATPSPCHPVTGDVTASDQCKH